ncbi:glycosyltransferase family 2 protein [Actinotalea soli]|uniref:glycosyltransferase family 2 protein n=1 Tax=Actinotalea soli TaxID=2819234 RepID=UPI0027DC15E1|nr:glycosyltransferase family 2 protein [Actinotalea soli]
MRVVCVTFNPGPELDDFATSLRAGSSAEVELVLVDNGTEHERVDRVVQEHGAVLVRDGHNHGYGGAANRGSTGARQRWIVVANPDVVWHPGALDLLLEAGERHPEAGALGPTLLNTDGTRYPSSRAFPSLVQGVGHALLGKVWPGNPFTVRYRQDHQEPRGDEGPTGWLSGACLLLRREAFEQVEGFDEAYFMFFEDLDLAERLLAAGWSSIHVPAAVTTHVGGTSWRARPEAMIRAHHRSAALYLSRRYPAWYQAPVRLVLRVGLLARQTVELRAAHRELR